MSYTCSCGSKDWHAYRTHTVYETLMLTNVQPNGCYEEDDNEMGDTVETGDFEEITCSQCDAIAPPDHPLWPKKES